MNYFSGAFRYVAGGESEPQNLVPRLIDRIKTSALPYDRRAAIVQLTEAAKSSPNSQVQVGELGLKVVYAVLEQDSDYDDTVKATLELLIAVCGKLDPPTPARSPDAENFTNNTRASFSAKFEHASAKAAETNIDVFLGLPNALLLLLQLLNKDDFYVKFGTIELLTAMAANSRNTLQMALLEAAEGVSRICDLLDDTHQHVRSSAVLLLSTLCDQSPEICKIVAFGGVLEKLFGLIETITTDSQGVSELSPDDIDEEDSLEAAIVVQDVLLVVRNLVNGTKTTKTLFRDTGCLPRLVNVVQRSAVDSGMRSSEAGKPLQLTSSGVKSAVQKQARKNLILALNCIVSLTVDSDEESQLVKSDLSATNLFKILSALGFPSLPEGVDPITLTKNILLARIWAFRTMSILVRGHDDFRVLFNSAAFSLSSQEKTVTMQVATLSLVMKEQSSSVRFAAFDALRSSLIVNTGLDLPSSALLSAMTGSAGSSAYSLASNQGVSHNSISSAREMSSTTSSMMHVVDTLKEALVGWPGAADAAGVFYAASLISWMVGRVENARERLLGVYVNGAALLQQIIRIIGKLEREKGPAEVRISLFSLICIWLHECPAAVSAFLSSAMPLPMLVDILRGSGSRGDIAEVHTKGLAAVVLGICFKVTLANAESSNNGGFLSGGRRPTTGHSHAAVADAIRTRIGVTAFTSCLDDLKMTKGFSDESKRANVWKLIDGLLQLEERKGYLSKDGDLGHDNWYSTELVTVVEDVYKTVSEKALDLVSAPQAMPSAVAMAMNGHLGSADTAGEEPSVLADSARDEVLNSYKEFIRAQDENLSAARRQIEELSTALRETQLELDSKAAHSTATQTSEIMQAVSLERDNLKSENKVLEALLEEKAADFSALSNAFAALEEEHTANATEYTQENGASASELERIRQQNSTLRESLNLEMQRSHDLSQRAAILDESVRLKEVELLSLTSERDHLRSSSNPEVAEALQWRRRAEVAEATISSRETMIDKYQASDSVLRQQLQELQRSQDEAISSIQSLQHQHETTKSELESLRATRKRELQVSREASAAVTASTQTELLQLRQQLAETQERLLQETAAKEKGPSDEEVRGFEKVQAEHQALTISFGQLNTEFLDSKQAVSQWQKRCEDIKSTRERERTDHTQLLSHSQALEGRLKVITGELGLKAQTAAAATTKVSELEQQWKEIDTIRHQTEEESILLKEQLASRIEQSIRLSGQLYELEESNARLHEQAQRFKPEMSNAKESQIPSNDQSPPGGTIETEMLRKRIVTLEAELDGTKEALSDSKDRESLSHAQARDREDAFAKIVVLEKSIEEHLISRRNLDEETVQMKERLLLVDEAEQAKRNLTAQVVALQKALSEASVNGSGSGGNVTLETENKEMDGRIMELQNVSDEKDLRLESLETSLNTALDRSEMLRREKEDLHKQVAEYEAMVSVLQSERESLSKETEELWNKVDSLPTRVAQNMPQVNDLEEENHDLTKNVANLNEKLQASEKRLQHSDEVRSGLSSELASMIEACKLSENEFSQMKADKDAISEKATNVVKEFEMLRAEYDRLSLSRMVEDVVNSVILDASLNVKSATEKNLKRVNESRIAALNSRDTLENEIGSLKFKLEEMQLVCEARDSALVKLSQQAAEINRLSNDLCVINLNKTEHNQLIEALDTAKCRIDIVSAEKDKVVLALEAERSRLLLQSGEGVADSIVKLTKERDSAVLALEQERVRSASEIEESKAAITNLTEERDKVVFDFEQEATRVASHIETSRGEIEKLAKDRDVALFALEQTKAELASNSQVVLEEKPRVIIEESPRPLKNRVSELEDALRDAARTVTATNRELIAAQLLLVELSADKTAMRTELACANESIENLSKRVLESSKPLTHGPALSEISEQDQNISEIPTGASSPQLSPDVAEQTLRSAHVEADNLRMALRRSMVEAESAAELLISIEARVKDVERRLKHSRAELSASRETEARLHAQLRSLQEEHMEQSDTLAKEINEQKLRASGLEAVVKETSREWSEKFEDASEKWHCERSNLREALAEANDKASTWGEKCDRLEEHIYSVKQELGDAREGAEQLKEAKLRLSDSLKTVKSSEAKLTEALQIAESREEDVKVALSHANAQKSAMKDAFEEQRSKTTKQHTAEIKELETDIDRINNVMEDTERRFRNIEGSLRSRVNQQSLEINSMKTTVADQKKYVASIERSLEDVSAEKTQSEARLAREVRERDEQLSLLKKEMSNLQTSLESTSAQRESFREQFEHAQKNILGLGKELEEEHLEKGMLETENQDFLSTVESLEVESKQIRSALNQKTSELGDTLCTLRKTEVQLRNGEAKIGLLETAKSKQAAKIEKLEDKKSTLEEKTTELNRTLTLTEQDRDSHEQDNKDLRAWVSDLERQAIELQTAASDFEEVEQSLRETLESNRHSNDQNAKLREELKKDKEALSAAEARVGQALRDKEAAESARHSSQKRSEELEARIREIREESLAKFNHSEEAMTSKAKQCAELETALAASQRKIAELESKSDELFGVKTVLVQRDEDIRNLKLRADAAERQVEELHQDLRTAESEVFEIKEASSGEGYRVIQAEHNELLVYLADLELEVTNLREELGRD